MRNTCAAVILFVLAWTAWAQVIEVPLEYCEEPTDQERRNSQGEFPYIPAGYERIELADAPETPLDLPDLPQHKIFYGSFTLGDTKFPLALARTQQGDKLYYTLYIDSNGDGSAKDNKPIKGTVQSSANDSYVYCTFREVPRITYRDGGKELPFLLRFSMWTDRPGINTISRRRDSLDMTSACGYRGEFTVNGRKYRILVGDNKLNGHFGDKLAPEQRQNYFFTRGDRYSLAGHGDKMDYWGALTVTDYVFLEGKAHKLAVDVPNGKLTLTPYEGEVAALKIPAEVERLEMVAPDSGASVAFVTPGTAPKIPPDKYKMTNYLLSRTEPCGDVWRLAAAATQRTPVYPVGGTEPALMKFGEPYNVQLTEQHLRRVMVRVNSGDPEPQEGYFMELGVTGSGFENVAAVEHIKGDKTKVPLSERNSRQPKEPTYKIVTDEGEVIGSGSFEYG